VAAAGVFNAAGDHIDSGGSEWATVLDRWSQSHTSAVPAVAMPPIRMPVGSSGYQPRV